MTDEMAALAGEFTSWHIWRARSTSGRETDWHATGRHHSDRKAARLAAADAAGLRALLAQFEALNAAVAA
jgi:hypothetical protein